ALLGDRRPLDRVDPNEVTGGTTAALAQDLLPHDHDHVEAVADTVSPTDDLAVVLDRSGPARLSDPGRVEPVEVDVHLDGLEALDPGDVPLDRPVGAPASELLAVVDVVAGLEGCGAVVEVARVGSVDGVQAVVRQEQTDLLDSPQIGRGADSHDCYSLPMMGLPGTVM